MYINDKTSGVPSELFNAQENLKGSGLLCIMLLSKHRSLHFYNQDLTENSILCITISF